MKNKMYKMFLGNQWVESGSIKKVFSPYDKSEVGQYHVAQNEHLNIALQMAQEAFKVTRKLSVYERAEFLEKIKKGIEENIENFARLIALEGGKPIRFARNETKRALITIQSAIDTLRTWNGEIIPLDVAPQTKSYQGLWKRFPIGPILGITPFNFPLNLVMHKLAPAIATGNPIILKPSSQTPLTSLFLAEIIQKAELPPGFVNIVPCSGSEIEYLVKNAGIKMISFTGSAETGWHLKEICGKKKITLELGGNAAAIVEKDADLEFAIPRLALGAMAHAGQVCISVQRIFVHRSIFSEFQEKFVKEIKNNIHLGNPLDESTVVGPIIDEKSLKRISEWVEESKKEGAHVLTGGKSSPPFYLPTVLTNTNASMKVWQKEVFAPVVLIEPYNNFDQALDMVNQSVYGLQAALFTNQMDLILKAYEQIDVGGLIVNDYPTFRIDPMPYGGIKDSGFGREGLKYAMEEMTEMKLMVIRRS